jgi:hypothetical protein
MLGPSQRIAVDRNLALIFEEVPVDRPGLLDR